MMDFYNRSAGNSVKKNRKQNAFENKYLRATASIS
jgi:hypothetical protein